VVRTLQFNGKQGGKVGLVDQVKRYLPNLCCPRNGKWSNLASLLDSASITATERFEHMLGKAMEVVPPARIPANKVVARQKK
jgi:hypothetical protein